MLRRWVVLTTFLLFVAVQWITTAHSESESAALKAWVGMYPHNLVHGRTFLDNADTLAGVISALGRSAIPQIKSMTTVGPILQRGDWIIAYGCQCKVVGSHKSHQFGNPRLSCFTWLADSSVGCIWKKIY
jgi:hypothetical protein